MSTAYTSENNGFSIENFSSGMQNYQILVSTCKGLWKRDHKKKRTKRKTLAFETWEKLE